MALKRLTIIAGISLVMLTACGMTTEADEPNVIINDELNRYNIIKDTETNCQYIEFDGAYTGGIIPRLNTEGKPMCGKEASE